MGVVIVMPAGAQVNPSTMGRHQIAIQVSNCMKKRMSVDRAISYNAAAKVCTDHVISQSKRPATGALVASDSPGKP